MHNIEVKARPRDFGRIEVELSRLGARDAGVETQHDVFFRCAAGRLKLRISSRDGATLIAYDRADAAGLRPSTYELAPVAEPELLLRVLDAALGRLGEVRKRRHLFWIDNVRVHLDDVDGLGRFLEIEAIVDAAHPEPACRRAAEALLERLGVTPDECLAVPYLDLLSPNTR